MASTLPLNGTNSSAPERPSFPGDGQAIGAMLDAHRRDAYNLAYRLLGRPEDAADAVQDAFLRVVRAVREDSAAPREPERFRSWLLRIVSNVAVDQLRQRARATTEPIDDLEQVVVAGDRGQPAYELDRREQRGSILRALLSLPSTQRAALTLRDYQGLSYEEIGKELGLTRAATTMVLFRARAAFRQAYEGTMAQTGSVGCSELAPLLSAMLDGELDRDVWRTVDQHLAQCGRCHRELRSLRRSRRLYSSIPLLVPPAGWSYGVLTGAATAEAAVQAAAAAAAVPVVAPAAVVTTSSVGSVLAVVGSFIGSKAAAVTVAAGVAVAANMTPLTSERPTMSAASDVATPSALRQRASPVRFTPMEAEAPRRPGKPVVAIDASDTSFAEADTAGAVGPSDAGPVHVVVAAATETSAGPETRSATQIESADNTSVTSAPADHEDRVATVQASTGSALPAPGDPVAVADVPGPAKADKQGSPDTPVGEVPPGQEEKIDQEDEEKPGKDKRDNEQPVAQSGEPGPPEHVKRDSPRAHAGGPPDQADNRSERANGPPEHVSGPPAHANAAPRRQTPGRATVQAPAPAAKPTGGNPQEVEGPPGLGNSEPPGHAHGRPPGGPPGRAAHEPPGQANPPSPAAATEQPRPPAGHGRPAVPGPQAQSARPHAEAQAANRPEPPTAKPDAVPPKPSTAKPDAVPPKPPPEKPATEKSGQEKPKPPDQKREEPKPPSKQNTSSAGSGNRREPPKPAPSKDTKPSNDSKPPKKK